MDVCPGASTNVACTVNDISGGFANTVWKGDSSLFTCDDHELTLRHTIANDTDECGLVSAQIRLQDGNNFTSFLMVNTTADLSGAVLPVQCTFPQPDPNPTIVVMEYSVSVTGE